MIFSIGLISVPSYGKADQDTFSGRWNVLLITIDTLRADKLSCYGGKRIKTPNIDGLARRGTLFTRAFAHNPLTLPSHANIMLGTTPPYHGVHDNMNFIVRDDLLTLAEHLEHHGYETGAVIGSFSLDSRFGLDQGFDHYDDFFKKKGLPRYVAGERNAETVTKIAGQWLVGRRAPWFLWMHIWDPHFPYSPPEPFLTQFRNKPYDGEVAYVDHVLGSFFQSLTELGIMDKTLIILTSDHGESLGDHGEKTHGMLAYNSTLWVPLILLKPGEKRGTSDIHVSHVDIFPTICDALGIERPDYLQGISLLPVLRGRRLPARKIYFESLEPYYNFGWAPLRGFIFKNRKFIDSPIFELYDLHTDFNERRNLADTVILGKLKLELKGLTADLSHPESSESMERYDYKTLEKLRSLGYMGYSNFRPKEKYDRVDDIKTLLPLFNQSIDAYAYRQDGEIETGIRRLRKMVEKRPRIYHPYVYLAKLLHAAGRTSEAMPVLEAGLRNFHSNYEVVRTYAEYLEETGRFEMVIDMIESRHLRGMDQDPQIWNILGKAYHGRGLNDKAAKAFERALSIDQEFVDALGNLGAVELAQSSQNQDDGAYFRAVDNLKRAVALDPTHQEAHFHLGHAYFQVGQMSPAVSHFEQSLSLGLRNGKTYYYLGIAYIGLGKLTHAYNYLSGQKHLFLHLLSMAEKQNLEHYLQRCRPKMKKSP